jgi:hypothetical protein
MIRDRAHVDKLSQRLLEGIRSKLDGVILNGSEEHRYPGNVNLSFAYVEGEACCLSLFPHPCYRTVRNGLGGPESIPSWLRSPNPKFSNFSAAW